MNQDSQPNKRINFGQYSSERKSLIFEKIFKTIGISFFFIIPFSMVLMVFSTPKRNTGEDLAAIIVLFFALCIGALIVSGIRSTIDDVNQRQKKLKADFLQTATAEERSLMDRQKKRGKLFLRTSILICIIAATSFYLYLSNQYKNAERLIVDEDYSEAITALESLPVSNFKDTQSLIGLCNAHLEYLDGDPLTAYQTLRFTSFSHQSEQQMKAISDFRTELKNIKDESDRQEEIRKQEIYEAKLRTGKPFVGMPESRINDTVLGIPSSDVRHNTAMVHGNRYTANLYDWYSSGKVIYTARCVQGEVTEVWDKSDKKSNTSSSYHSSTSSSSHTVSSDPSVEGYSDPEDFYDDYWDDFFDYEDAEDYYYSHGGK